MKTTLQERIKDRMTVMGMTNAQLAAACKVKPPTSYNWASGKTKNIKGVPLLLAARALGVTPEWLSTGLGNKYPEHGTRPQAQESTVEYFPPPKLDDLSTELLKLFSQLDASGKNEYLVFLRGFVAGRRPHHNGKASAMAG